MLIKGKLFQATKPVPASLLSEMALGHSWVNYPDESEDLYHKCDAEMNWATPWHDFLGLSFTYEFNDEEDDYPPIPPEVKKQLIGQKLKRGLHFVYKGKECYVIGGTLPDNPLGCELTEEDVARIYVIYAVDARYIDMDK